MDQKTQGLSGQFREELRRIRISLDNDRAQPNAVEQGPLLELVSYLDSIHFRMAGIATICESIFDSNDTKLAECLAIFKQDIQLAFTGLIPLLIGELERNSQRPQ